MANEAKETKVVRARQFTVIRNYYYETHNEKHEVIDKISESDWRKKILEDFKGLDASEKLLIFHDRDVDEHGMPKNLHCHGILKYKNARTNTSIMKSFGSRERDTIEIKNGSGAYRYLLHISEGAIKDEKHLYSIDELYAWENGKELDDEAKRRLYSKRCKAKEKKVEAANKQEVLIDISEKLESGEMSRDMVGDYLVEKLGRYGHYVNLQTDSLWDTAMKMRADKRKWYKLKHGRRLSTMYFHGRGAAGKTQFAEGFIKYLARKDNYTNATEYYSRASAAKDKDTFYMLDKYQSQPVLFMDDVPGRNLSYGSFNAAFTTSENSVPVVYSRYGDKEFLADLCIITYSATIENYTRSLREEGYAMDEIPVHDVEGRKNIDKQIYRRIETVVSFKGKEIIVKRYSYETEGYVEDKVFTFEKAIFRYKAEEFEEVYEYLAGFTTLGKRLV